MSSRKCPARQHIVLRICLLKHWTTLPCKPEDGYILTHTQHVVLAMVDVLSVDVRPCWQKSLIADHYSVIIWVQAFVWWRLKQQKNSLHKNHAKRYHRCELQLCKKCAIHILSVLESSSDALTIILILQNQPEHDKPQAGETYASFWLHVFKFWISFWLHKTDSGSYAYVYQALLQDPQVYLLSKGIITIASQLNT